MKTYILVFCYCLVSLANAQLTATQKATLDSLFSRLDATQKAMGSFTILHKGNIVYEYATGYKHVSKKQKAQTSTRYRIGSITKMFTAVIIYQLIQEGKLSLSTPLNTFYPSIPNSDKITIHHLLWHASGLYNYTDNATVQWMATQHSKESLVSYLSKQPADFDPGAKHAYSNTNYLLLGFIAEDIEQKPYAQIVNARITAPSGLKNTYYGQAINLKNNEAYSYFKDGKKWVDATYTDMSAAQGAGAMVSTTGDLVSFMWQLFHGKLLNTESIKSMTAFENTYGCGIFEFPFNNKNLWGHNGSIDGFASLLVYDPSDSLVVAYCSNGEDESINTIVLGGLKIWYGLPYVVPDFKDIQLDVPTLKLFSGVYASTLFPLKITIFEKGGQLYGQADGQGAFPLTARTPLKFTFDAAGIEMEFNADRTEMKFSQGGQSFLFIKQP